MTTRRQRGDLRLRKATLGPLATATAALLTLAACGGGGGGGGNGGGGGGGGNPGPTNNAPTVSTDSLLLTSAGDSVTLTATGSDPDGDPLTYTWAQSRGADVDSASGADSSAYSFNAPAEVDTLTFTISVSDGSLSASSSVQLIVLEDENEAVFVDGAYSGGGSDGSLDAPFTSLRSAIESGSVTADYYIKTLPNSESYDITGTSPFDELELESNSLYGGYDDNWLRDVATNRTLIVAGIRALDFSNFDQPVTVSGLDITGGEIDTNTSKKNASGPIRAAR